MKKYGYFLSVVVMLFCSLTCGAQKLTVAVAANMQYVVEELLPIFKTETGIDVDLVVGSSGKLATQITEGAPFDVFISADMKYPNELFHKGLATEPAKAYAQGKLVLWTNTHGIQPTANLKILLQSSIVKIAVANPKTAPYGEAAEQAMKYYKVYTQVKDKLVYGESIGQTQQFIDTKAADIGFIAKSQVLTDEMMGKGFWIEVDKKAYAPIMQGAVILKHGKMTNEYGAKHFFEFLFTTEAKTVFKKYGYIVSAK